MIIALAGKLHSGKGTISDYLVEKYRFKRVGFADAIKAMAKDIGWNGIKDDAGRKLLQDLGLAIRRHLGEEVIINAAFSKLDSSNWVIDDLRTRGEAAKVKQIGAVLVKVERPDLKRSGEIYRHHTETDLDH